MDYKPSLRPHTSLCDWCGNPFECYCDTLRGDDGDGNPAPSRRCAYERALCEGCYDESTKDAHDYACEKADADNKSEREN